MSKGHDTTEELKAAAHRGAMKQAVADALAALPPEVKEWKLADRRARRANEKQNRNKKIARDLRAVLLRGTGYSQLEIAKIIGIDEQTVRRILDRTFPFSPHPGRDYRYVISRMSPPSLTALDRLCNDMAPRPDRQRALELILTAVLEEDATVARRTLRIVRSTQQEASA